MFFLHGEIVPGCRVGDIRLGITKEDLIAIIGVDYIEYQYSPIIEIENAIFTFEDGELCQICVTDGFEGAFHNISIGSTMQDVQRELGDWVREGDSCAVWQPSKFPGICFELGDYGDDTDEWDETVAPIEWICVYLADKRGSR